MRCHRAWANKSMLQQAPVAFSISPSQGKLPRAGRGSGAVGDWLPQIVGIAQDLRAIEHWRGPIFKTWTCPGPEGEFSIQYIAGKVRTVFS